MAEDGSRLRGKGTGGLGKEQLSLKQIKQRCLDAGLVAEISLETGIPEDDVISQVFASELGNYLLQKGPKDFEVEGSSHPRNNVDRAAYAMHAEGVTYRSYAVTSLMHFHESVIGLFSEDIRELLMKMFQGKLTIFVVHG